MRELQHEDFLRLLEIHNPIPIREEHIRLAEKESSDEPILVDMSANYSTIEVLTTGGYLLPTEILPWRFKNRLVSAATDTRIYGDQHGMIEEMISNAIEHGNRMDKSKMVYLLWHLCDKGKEAYIADQGETDFNLEEGVNARRAFAASFGKYDDYSGIDLLRWYSKDFEYFRIVDSSPKKKGTLLRIVLELEKQNPKLEQLQTCTYLGHQVFAKPNP